MLRFYVLAALVGCPLYLSSQLSIALRDARVFSEREVVQRSSLDSTELAVLRSFLYYNSISKCTGDCIAADTLSRSSGAIMLDSVLLVMKIRKLPRAKQDDYFPLLQRLLHNKAASVYHPVILSEILEQCVYDGADFALTERYLAAHKACSQDTLELLLNQYYLLRHQINILHFQQDTVLYLDRPFKTLLASCEKHGATKLAARVSSSLGAYYNGRAAQQDSAIHYFSESIEMASKCEDLFAKEMTFINSANIAHAQLKTKNYEEALSALKQVDTTSNRLKDAQNRALYYSWLSQSYRGLGKIDSALLYTDEASIARQLASREKYDDAIREIEESYQNKVLASDLRQTTLTLRSRNYLTAFIALLLLGSILALILFRRLAAQKRKTLEDQIKLKNVEAQNQKLKALESERTRIASEMHDDLGGGLTSIKFLSQSLLRKTEDQAQKKQIHKIADNAQQLVSNMSEIIWAMNAGFDTLEDLIAYSRRYAYEYMEDYPVQLSFKVLGDTTGIALRGERRRHILLILKEALHNTAKHAQATEVNVTFAINQDQLVLTIKDNGVGLETTDAPTGNGLKNMQKRAESMGGFATISSDHGTTVSMTIPLDEIDP